MRHFLLRRTRKFGSLGAEALLHPLTPSPEPTPFVYPILCCMDRHLSLVIAHSSPIFAQGLSLLLQQQPDICVRGIAHSPAVLREQIQQFAPLVVLVETQLGLPDCAFLPFELKTSHPETGIVLFGAAEPSQLILSALVAGAEGFVPKHAPISELLRAIRLADRGQSYISPDLNKGLSQAISRMRAREGGKMPPCSLLTEKEQQVLLLICREYTTKEICQALQLKPSTVDTHRKRLLEKTGAKNVAGLVLYAVREGFVPR